MDDKPLHNMQAGEKGWVTPWSLEIFPDMSMRIRTGTPVAPESGGTSCVPIEKTPSGINVLDLVPLETYLANMNALAQERNSDYEFIRPLALLGRAEYIMVYQHPTNQIKGMLNE